MLTAPPVSLFPLPTTNAIAPAFPDSESPVPKKSDPLEPELDVPVLNVILPLRPEAPALLVSIVTDPLDELRPYPLVIRTEPPLDVLE